MMTEDRRQRSLLDQALAWLTRSGVALIVYFLLQIVQKIDQTAKSVDQIMVRLAVLEERTRSTREAR